MVSAQAVGSIPQEIGREGDLGGVGGHPAYKGYKICLSGTKKESTVINQGRCQKGGQAITGKVQHPRFCGRLGALLPKRRQHRRIEKDGQLMKKDSRDVEQCDQKWPHPTIGKQQVAGH